MTWLRATAPSLLANKGSRLWLFRYTFILFGAFALRLWNLGTQSLWHDEAWSIFSAYHPLAVGQANNDPNTPPGYFISLSIWQHLAGDGVWAMRYWSLLIGVIGVAVVILVTRRWFGGRAGALVGILAAASPILWVFSQETRAYILMPLLAIVLLPLVDSFLRTKVREQRQVWFWIAMVEIVALYVQNLSVPIVAWLNVTVAAVLLLRREWGKTGLWLATQTGVLLLYLPWLLTQKPTGTPLNTPPPLSPALLWDIWQSYFTGIAAMLNADPTLMALTAGFGLIAIIGIVLAISRRRSQQMWLALSQAVLIPVFEFVIIRAAHIDFHPRYFIVGVPAALMVITAGWAGLPRSLSPSLLAERGKRRTMVMRLSGRVSLAAATGVALFGIVIMVRMAAVTYSSPVYQHDDFRAVAERYARLGPDDAIIIPYGWEPTLDYYGQKLGFKARIIGVPVFSSAEAIIERLQAELKTVKRAELLTWYQLPADVRGAYPCLLGAMGRQRSDPIIVEGLTSVGYDSFVVDTSDAFVRSLGHPVDFGAGASDIIRLLAARAYAGPDRFCVVTRWELLNRTSENLRLAARIYNDPLNWEVAQADVALLSDRQLPTSVWTENQIESAFALLALPPGSPNQPNYRFGVSLYNGPLADQPPQGLNAWAVEGSTKTPIILPVIIGAAPNRTDPALTVRPTNSDIPVSDGLYLHRKDIPTKSGLDQGEQFPVELEWWRTSITDEPEVTLVLEGSGWSVESPLVFEPKPRLLTWSQLQVPVTATGTATLKVQTSNGASVSLGRYAIVAVPRLFTEPGMILTQRVNADFPGAGTLVGSTITQSPIKSGNPFPVTLLWKASDTSAISYTVFVHLLDSNGQVIAQSDSLPAGGTRPTTSWLKGEYLIDQHTLTFNRRDYVGLATLEAGLYDPSNGKRVLLQNGDDHFLLPVQIVVQSG